MSNPSTKFIPATSTQNKSFKTKSQTVASTQSKDPKSVKSANKSSKSVNKSAKSHHKTHPTKQANKNNKTNKTNKIQSSPKTQQSKLVLKDCNYAQHNSEVNSSSSSVNPVVTSSPKNLGATPSQTKALEGGVVKLHKMITPLELIKEFSLSDDAYVMIEQTRQDIAQILQQEDDRLIVIVGPCSIHDPQAGLEYATRLSQILPKYQQDLCIVMRVYFEKPRTTIGWKGLINDPRLDDSYKINEGIAKARKLLVAINELGVPCAGEFLDNLVPQYLADLMSWGAIGARTTESQLHRELASGINCPIGFKNTTQGGVRESIDAIMSASRPHTFLGINPTGKIAIIETAGNPNLHVILRGGSHGTNFDQESVKSCCDELSASGFRPQVMIDFSHANSQKDYRKQAVVLDSVYQQLTQTTDLAHARSIMGVMIESNLVEGKQQLTATNKDQLVYGQSITDGCISWEDTEYFLDQLAQAVQLRRQHLARSNFNSSSNANSIPSSNS